MSRSTSTTQRVGQKRGRDDDSTDDSNNEGKRQAKNLSHVPGDTYSSLFAPFLNNRDLGNFSSTAKRQQKALRSELQYRRVRPTYDMLQKTYERRHCWYNNERYTDLAGNINATILGKRELDLEEVRKYQHPYEFEGRRFLAKVYYVPLQPDTGVELSWVQSQFQTQRNDTEVVFFATTYVDWPPENRPWNYPEQYSGLVVCTLEQPIHAKPILQYIKDEKIKDPTKLIWELAWKFRNMWSRDRILGNICPENIQVDITSGRVLVINDEVWFNQQEMHYNNAIKDFGFQNDIDEFSQVLVQILQACGQTENNITYKFLTGRSSSPRYLDFSNQLMEKLEKSEAQWKYAKINHLAMLPKNTNSVTLYESDFFLYEEMKTHLLEATIATAVKGIFLFLPESIQEIKVNTLKIIYAVKNNECVYRYIQKLNDVHWTKNNNEATWKKGDRIRVGVIPEMFPS